MAVHEGSDTGAEDQLLVDTVIATFADTPDHRLREVMSALVSHLHAFIREVRLTEDEWLQAITFLTRVGHITDERRQEFILLSDVLGASMQTILINDDAGDGATEATVVGPFFVENSPEAPLGGDTSNGASGQPCWVEGRVTDTAGPHLRERESRYGTPTTTASTTCSTRTVGQRPGPTSTPTVTVITASGR